MIDNTYKICNYNLHVYCNIDEYSKIISNWLNPFSIIKSKNSDAYIKIEKGLVAWKIGDKEYSLDKTLVHTDLYPLFYNVISNLVLNDNKLLMHSSVVSLNGNGVLILGDFNSGKTTLSLEANDSGFEILSTDQSIIKIINNDLYLIKGSTYIRNRDNKDTFISSKINKTKIKLIINLVGLSDNGDLVLNEVSDTNHIIKGMFKYCTWHSDIPLFSKDVLLDINRIKIKKMLSKIIIPFYNIRGDKVLIVDKLKELL